MKCQACGSILIPMVTDLPFKLSEATIVIVKAAPVLQCEGCSKYTLEEQVMEWVDTILKRADPSAELEITRVFEAFYEDGVLKLLQDPGLPEYHRYSVRVQELREKRAADDVSAWHRVDAGLSEEDIADVEKIALDRSRSLRHQPE